MRLSLSSHAALGALAFAIAGACATPPEDEVIGGLPCDSAGSCASGFVCIDSKCVRPGTQSASNGGSSAGGLANDASSGGDGTGGAADGGGVGVGQDAGSGGAFGGAGSGGVAAGGAGGRGTGGGGAGGVGGAGGTGGSTTSLGTYCGGAMCDVGSSCCSDPDTGNMTCEGGGCDSGVARIECDGPEDCSNGESCCRESGTLTVRYSCQATCGTGTVPMGCSGPHNCPAPKVCCETTVSAFPPRASDTACVDSCTGLNHYVMCNSDADCPSTEPSCEPAGALPGFFRCF